MSQHADLLSTICTNSTVREIPKGQLLLKEGEVCKYIYYLESGHLRFYYEKDDRQINVHFAFEEQYATNLKSFVYGLPSEYFIEAGETCFLRKLDKPFVDSLSQNGNLAAGFTYNMIQLAISQEEHNHFFKIYTPAERYEFVAKNHPILLQRISLVQLCSYLGISRKTLCRIRRNIVTP